MDTWLAVVCEVFTGTCDVEPIHMIQEHTHNGIYVSSITPSGLIRLGLACWVPSAEYSAWIVLPFGRSTEYIIFTETVRSLCCSCDDNVMNMKEELSYI